MNSTRYSLKIFNVSFQFSLFVVVMVLWTIVVCNPIPFHHGSGVDLPKAEFATYQARSLRDDALLAAVAHDGIIYFRSDRVNIDDLVPKLTVALGSGAERKLYIRADQRARYERVKEVLDGARTAGIQNVVFLVE